MLFASIDQDGGSIVFPFVLTRRLANCVFSLKAGNSLGNTFPTSTCIVTHVICAANVCLTTELTLVVNWYTQGTELKYATNVRGSW